MEEADSAGRPRIAHSPEEQAIGIGWMPTSQERGSWPALSRRILGGRRWHSGSDVVMTSARAHVPGRMLWREWWPRGRRWRSPQAARCAVGARVGRHRSHIQALVAGGALLGHHSGMPDFASGIAGRLSTGVCLRIHLWTVNSTESWPIYGSPDSGTCGSKLRPCRCPIGSLWMRAGTRLIGCGDWTCSRARSFRLSWTLSTWTLRRTSSRSAPCLSPATDFGALAADFGCAREARVRGRAAFR